MDDENIYQASSHLVALTRADDTLTLLAIIQQDGAGDVRLVTDEIVENEIARTLESERHGEHPDNPVIRWRFLDPAELPTLEEDIYRNAWRDTGQGIQYDIARAREIHRERIRLERGPLLGALDVEQLRALARKDDAAVASIETRKQALRDATRDAAIDRAIDVAQLRAITLGG